jgi:ABC-2 type transport system permease protein/lipopolysaccharide transport system permease protein
MIQITSFIDGIKGYNNGFKKYSYLLTVLIKRDIKKKYKGSILGIFWSLLNPLLHMIVLTVIFSMLFIRKIDNFPLYIVSGRLIFGFFTQGTTSAMNSIISSAPLIKKVYMPKYIIVLAKVTSAFIIFLISLIDLLFVVLITKAHFSIYFLLTPVYLLLLLLFVTGVGLLLATIATFFRDMTHLYSVITLIIMYMSAIFYPPEIVPENLQIIFLFNPVFHFIEGFRSLVYFNTLPSLSNLLYCSIVSIVFMVFGSYVFIKNQDKFIFNI